MSTAPPCPPLDLAINVPADPELMPDCKGLPEAPGVFIFENADAEAIAIARTANLRRLVRSRLTPLESDELPSRRVDYRSIVGTVRATTVGSAFEADWTILQHARSRLPGVARSIVERHPMWFIHVNPDHKFPQFIKTASPGRPPTGSSGRFFGPFSDKHAAQRAIEALVDAFDLCRYHNILVQSPAASACAYKEMGRCPAPCDGTVSLNHYNRQIQDAIAFCEFDCDGSMARLRQEMADAGTARKFEIAAAIKRRIEALSLFTKPSMSHLTDARSMRWIGVMPGERPGDVRLFTVLGGWIEHLADVDHTVPLDDLRALHEASRTRVIESDWFDPALLENLAIVVQHLLPYKKTKGCSQAFVPMNAETHLLQRAVMRVGRTESTDALEERFTDLSDAGPSG